MSCKLIPVNHPLNHCRPLKVAYLPSSEEECKHGKVPGCWALTFLGCPLCSWQTFAGSFPPGNLCSWVHSSNLQKRKCLLPLVPRDFSLISPKPCRRYYLSISRSGKRALRPDDSPVVPAGSRDPSDDQMYLLSNPSLCLVWLRLNSWFWDNKFLCLWNTQ